MHPHIINVILGSLYAMSHYGRFLQNIALIYIRRKWCTFIYIHWHSYIKVYWVGHGKFITSELMKDHTITIVNIISNCTFATYQFCMYALTLCKYLTLTFLTWLHFLSQKYWRDNVQHCVSQTYLKIFLLFQIFVNYTLFWWALAVDWNT